MPRSVFLVEGICADGVGDVDVTDASVGPDGVIRMVVSPSSMAMNMPRYHLSRPARNARLALIRSLQPIDIDFLRPRFSICFPILFSYPQVSSRKLDFLPPSDKSSSRKLNFLPPR
jgi:hypothetical protein